MKKKNLFWVIASVAISVLALSLNTYAAEPDWSKIPETNIVLFQPGQTSWEFLTSDAHPGSIAVSEAKASCTDCHRGKEADLAIKSMTHREPTPITGKEPLKVISLKAAHDDTYAYFWFRWTSREPSIIRKYQVFDGKEWKGTGGVPRPENVKKGVPAQYEDRLNIMLDDTKLQSFTMNGCYITCHNDLRYMPNEAKKDDVKTHAYLGDKGIKKSDIRKYIPESRTNIDKTGGWSNVRSKEELENMKKEGLFVELLQWRANRGNPISILDDGYVLEYRLFDSDGKFMEDNYDKDKKQPKYMFDESKTGMRSFPYDQVKNQKYYYISKDIAVPFDPNAEWKKGDAIPDPIIFTPKDNTSSAHGEWKDSSWTVVIKRKLHHGNPLEDKTLKPGNIYNVSIALHEDNTTHRFHYVSFAMTMGFDNPKLDVNIVKAK